MAIFQVIMYLMPLINTAITCTAK